MSDLHTPPKALQDRDKVAETLPHPTAVQFVDGLVPKDEAPKGPAKLHHKKSRKGCQRCRSRRVKCDEVHPICGGCKRHQVSCLYDRDRPMIYSGHAPRDRAISEHDTSNASPGISSTETETPEIPESKSRRLLELKLLHHYDTHTGSSLTASGDPAATVAWTRVVPNLAFGNDALLYSIYALSALHIAEAEPENWETMETHRRYLDMALREHQNDISRLSESNFDAVCMASSFLRIHAFAMLRERPLVPYTPPVLWLDMTRGAFNVFDAAWDWIKNDETSITSKLTKRMPEVFDEEAKFAESNRQGLLHLLHRNDQDVVEEPWDEDIQETYKSTVSYIGFIWMAMKADKPPAQICRRLLVFPYLIKARFIELVKDQQPRALAVLAHYFALLARFRSLWWIADAGPRELHALNTLFSDKRPDLMDWPLQLVNEGAPYT